MIRDTYYLIVKADSVLRNLMREGALMTYQEFSQAVGLTMPQEAWTPGRQREVADLLSVMAALERRFSRPDQLDFRRILSPTQVRMIGGDSDDAA